MAQINNKIGYEVNLVSVFLENKVGNQDSIALEIRMQDRLKYDASAPTHSIHSAPTPPSNYSGMYGAKGGSFNFGLKYIDQKFFDSKTLTST